MIFCQADWLTDDEDTDEALRIISAGCLSHDDGNIDDNDKNDDNVYDDDYWKLAAFRILRAGCLSSTSAQTSPSTLQDSLKVYHHRRCTRHLHHNQHGQQQQQHQHQYS